MVRHITRASRGILTLLLLGAALAAQPANQTGAGRVVAVGDIHGASDALKQILGAAGVVDGAGKWSGGRTILVQTGDYTDRGEHVLDVLDLLMRLEEDAKRAGGRAEILLGNHEVMNLLHEFRDVSPQMYAAFAGAGSEEKRKQGYGEYQQAAKRAGAAAIPEEQWLAAHPAGFLEYVDAIGPRGRYGRWLRARKVVVRESGTLLMHAGLAPETTGTLEDVNRTVQRDIENWDKTRQLLVRAGLIRPFYTLQETLEVANGELNRIAAALKAEQPPGDHVTKELVERLQWALEIGKSSLLNPDGPMWYRGLSRLPESDEAQIDALLKRFDASRFVVAHTPVLPGRITPRFKGRVFLIDTGMLSTHFKSGRASALEITGDRVSAIYSDSREVLVDAAVAR